jgi:crotonobetainyl-CoA:carnitine CoA-transferase CaiB-like acyl-CoA transferase
MILADMGAEVIKAERAGTGEDTRLFGPWKDGVSLYFPAYNRNKKSITVDFRSDEGKALLRKLVEKCDVIVENFRVGVMAKMGLTYDEVKKINPRAIMASVTGFGQTGPYSDRVSFDGVVSAMSGMTAPAEPGGRPGTGHGAISDTMTATHVTIGILLALYDRERTGRGQFLDMAMLNSMVVLQSPVLAGYAMGGPLELAPESAPRGVLKAKDGYIYINAATTPMFKRLREFLNDDALNNPEYDQMEARVRDVSKLLAAIEKWMSDKTCDEVEEIFAKAALPVAVVANQKRILANPQLRANNQIIDIDIPGVGPVPYIASPVKLSERPVEQYTRPPEIGEHNEEVYLELLGMDRAEYDDYRNRNII